MLPVINALKAAHQLTDFGWTQTGMGKHKLSIVLDVQ